jgi:putative membrane protein
MKAFQKILICFLALEHFAFMVLEMFFWNTPIGHKIFKLPPEIMAGSEGLAANQGLYNGFLAVGLVWSLLNKDDKFSSQLQMFFVICIIIAGIFGAVTAKPSIFFVQALPAIITLILTVLTCKQGCSNGN